MGPEAALAALKQRFLDLLRRRYEDGPLGRGRSYAAFEDFCAAVLQGFWQSRTRMRMARRVAGLTSSKIFHVAAFEIQRCWQMFQDLGRSGSRRRRAEKEVTLQYTRRRNNAAFCIQVAWLGLVNFRVYRTLRDTIGSFRRSGDPYLLLKAVLPREAVLLDPAMQVHVRFRLGGMQFPPNIYYKIFTHGAVVDVCAFAPRNYAAERTAGASRNQGWYERMENNGWRPLIVRLAAKAERYVDEVEKSTARKPVKNFHFSRLKRRQDLEQHKRQRTLDWMRRLYGLDASRAVAEGADAIADEVGLPDDGALGASYAVGAAGGIAGAARRAAEPHPTPLKPRPPPGAPQGPRRRILASSNGRPNSGGSSQLATEDGGSEGLCAVDEFPEDLTDADSQLLEWSKGLNFDAYMEGWQTTATSNGSEGCLPIAKSATMRLLARSYA